jgi:LmbE family N-acetylglucosaminyl deacetylase
MAILQLKAPGAEIYIPDGTSLPQAAARTTHLGICAHQDDLEIMAYHGILECFGKKDKWFAGATMTNGQGSARDMHYKEYTDEQMVDVRRLEQKKAAYIGEFGAMFLTNHPSKSVKDPANADVAADLDAMLSACQPEVVYTHNLADKHDTHVAVALRTIAAIRRLPKDKRPKKVIGCEVWRDLDWLSDADKVVMPVDSHENLADSLMGVFDSQICGGKRYDLAARGRRLAHATFFESHQVDKYNSLIWGMDLTPLIQDDKKDPFAHVQEHIDRFTKDVKDRVAKFSKA